MTKAYRTDRLRDDDTDPDPDTEDVELDDDGDLAEMTEFNDDCFEWADNEEEDAEPIDADDFA